MNIAQRIKEHYNSDDFKNMYSEVLFESFNYNENDIVERIESLFNTSNYETQKYLKNHKTLTKKQSKLVYDFIVENFEEFTSDFKNYYVGYTSLDSVNFGEQEEQLDGIFNYKTGKNYSINYLKKVFESECFYVNESDYAYYDLSDEGLHIDLLNNISLLDEFLLTV